jgi:prepilin-type processing-associated H-X9-DG protein
MQQSMGGVKFQGGMFTNGTGLAPSDIRDGLSNTLCVGEVLPAWGPQYGGPPGDGMLAEGGQAFEGYLTPNSSAPDVVCNTCPLARGGFGMQGNVNTSNATGVKCVVDMNDSNQVMAARSMHNGGVNAALGDGSVHYFNDTIDVAVWRALCSAWGGDIVGTANF